MKITLKEQLKNPENKYRPIPFWSWNENLSCDETKWQIEEMNRVGIGGYFMHARGGLQTEYMGGEWMDNIKVGINEGKEKQMGAWGYDENGWPSGFGNGEVNGLGIAFQQKYLRFEKTQSLEPTAKTIVIKKIDDCYYHFFYDINPFYVDVLDGKVTRNFIEMVHERYKNELGEAFSSLAGFFTDEPQISRNGIPWSFILEAEYTKRYQEDLLDNIEDLFFETNTTSATRVRFWSLVRDLFAENFMKQIYDWCNENNVLLTGHMVLEETLHSQLTSNGSCMPNYEYMHIPGMDWLTRSFPVNVTSLQLASVGHQLDKKQMISETFALCGWNVSFEELKWIYESQMVRGVNLMCQHLEGYTLRGIRKRDYPATLFYQQPWWDDYKLFNDSMTRIGVLLTEGKVKYKVLMLHPQSSAWITYDDSKNEGLDALDQQWSIMMKEFEDNQINFHLGDEKILERHAKIQGYHFVVGTQSYEVVVVPPMENISMTVFDLLQEFRSNEGAIMFSEMTPSLVDGVYSPELCSFVSSYPKLSAKKMVEAIYGTCCEVKMKPEAGTESTSDVSATVRHFETDGFDMVYIVNSSLENKKLAITLPYNGVVAFDPLSGEIYPIEFKAKKNCCVISHDFDARGSLVLFAVVDEEKMKKVFTNLDAVILKAKQKIVSKSENVNNPSNVNNLSIANNKESGIKNNSIPLGIDPDAAWKIEEIDPNAITLDYCDCYFDGVCVGEGMPVNNIQEMACKIGKPVKIKLVYKFFVKDLDIKSLSVVIETPEKFDIALNGVPVKKEITGYYRDKSFKTIPLTNGLLIGNNELTCEIQFKQQPQVYENINNSLVFESEKNKLTYDDEIEAIYLIGDFGVETPGEFLTLARQAVSYKGGFALTKKPESVLLKSIVSQGFPFFSGKIKLSHVISLKKDELENRIIRFEDRTSTTVKVIVNGKDAGMILWAPYEVSLDGLLVEGENIIEIVFTGTLRNLLGPHHMSEGESYCVGPGSFFQESALWVGGKNGAWVDSYCFVDFVGPLAK